MQTPKYTLPVIVVSQFLCTSLWFAGNGVMDDLIIAFSLNENALGSLTSAVQLGFILGTLIFAALSIADRYSPSRVFFVCALLGAAFNLGVIWEENSFASILAFRFFTGFFLAGIYPVGMKIAADYFEKGLGRSLGFLVGALVVGTSLPHLLKDLQGDLPWELVLICTSLLAAFGGVLMFALVPNGPYRKRSQHLRLSAIWVIFKDRHFRAAAFGYFGHMWELYTFWALVPVLLLIYLETNPAVNLNIPLWSFLIIGIGGVACILAGFLAEKFGVKKIASTSLFLSFLCCMVSPLAFAIPSLFGFLCFLLFWGMVVIADSPLFSTLVAQNAPVELKGTALTIVNSIGFFITILSIQLINGLRIGADSNTFLVALGLGPIIGLIALGRKSSNKHS